LMYPPAPTAMFDRAGPRWAEGMSSWTQDYPRADRHFLLALRRHGGDVDKFVGDAMFAWFSGPARCRHAIDAAVEILSGLHERFAGKAGTEIGFGIHVGEVVVGSMGSQDRRDYTAIGRSVNLAARLCSAAKSGQILVSEAVATELEQTLALIPLPPISAKGFTEPVRVFEVDLAKRSQASNAVEPRVTTLP